MFDKEGRSSSTTMRVTMLYGFTSWWHFGSKYSKRHELYASWGVNFTAVCSTRHAMQPIVQAAIRTVVYRTQVYYTPRLGVHDTGTVPVCSACCRVPLQLQSNAGPRADCVGFMHARLPRTEKCNPTMPYIVWYAIDGCGRARIN